LSAIDDIIADYAIFHIAFQAFRFRRRFRRAGARLRFDAAATQLSAPMPPDII
jgi:hypothetical protein